MFPKHRYSAPLATLRISTAAMATAAMATAAMATAAMATAASEAPPSAPTPRSPAYAAPATPNTPVTAPPSPSYRLSPNDTVLIHVFQEQELDTTARIAKDGTIPFPLIGSIHIGGRTVPEASALLAQALREYLVHPQISVRITDYNKRKFTVLGQVNRPGSFEMPEENPLNLLEAIGLAGGYNRIANPSKVIVKRHGTEGERVFRLDAKQMAKGRNTPAFLLEHGDTVIVEESLF